MKRHVLKVIVLISACTAVFSGVFLFKNIKRGAADAAVYNSLRNLSVIAEDYFQKNGVTSVEVGQLDKVKLYNAGIRGPIAKVQPLVIHKGQPVEAISLDSQRIIRFTP